MKTPSIIPDQTPFLPYEKLSPFEIKDKLAQLAHESSKKSDLAFLNAGRGNPNWVATTPREAFFLLGQFAIEECKRVMDLPDLGGMPKAPGIARRFEQFPQASSRGARRGNAARDGAVCGEEVQLRAGRLRP